ncbi:MAG: hypothetical protein QOC77_3121 [Thermoleophilaceae bacterium]|jgi:hypothetical protein|nr:hypothetical protein [Thermoleophilaceae bacterium]MEA2469758.1 hypothetical protein [Thermoleophilaceae bacterium]
MFESLDFIYTPSADVAADVERFATVLGASIEFAIERFGTRVAMIRLAGGPPDLVLAEHLHGEQPILVYRVPDLQAAVERLEANGLDAGAQLGFPYGPIHSFTLPGTEHRIAIYELTRPQARGMLAGRRDF